MERGPSSTAEQTGFLLSGGGSSPTGPLHTFRAVPCAFSDVSHIFARFHYRGEAFGGSAKHIFGLTDGWTMLGGAVFGETWHRDTHGKAADGVLELKRFCLVDDTPRNAESYFLGACARMLRRQGYCRLLAYSDPSAGHKGTIYKAAGWKMSDRAGAATTTYLWNGRTYHARSLTIDRPYAKELAAALERGEAVPIAGQRKLLFTKDL